jgi:hypothetical protein
MALFVIERNFAEAIEIDANDQSGSGAHRSDVTVAIRGRTWVE